MTDALVLAVRQRFCRQDAEARWVCPHCDATLGDNEIAACSSCVARMNAERAARDAAEHRRSWEADQRARVAQVLEPLPRGPHLQSSQGTAALIDRRLVAVAERWVPSAGSLLLVGPSGAGKTTAVARAVHRLADQRLCARLAAQADLDAKRAFLQLSGFLWVKASALGRALSEHRLGAGREPELMTRAVEASVLFLDELGPELPHHAGALFDLVDRRGDVRLPTVVTSGQTLEALTARYGSGLARRLSERGLGALVDLYRHARGRDG